MKRKKIEIRQPPRKQGSTMIRVSASNHAYIAAKASIIGCTMSHVLDSILNQVRQFEQEETDAEQTI